MEDDTAASSSAAAVTEGKNDKIYRKVAMAQELRGGVAVAVDVTNGYHARLAQAAGACCVVVSADSRMADPSLIAKIKRGLRVPVMARVRVGHFAEAQIVESIGVKYIDESEITGIADANHFINKHNFGSAFVCGSRDLGEALRRITEGASMVRAQGESSGSGNIAATVRSVRTLMGEIRDLVGMDEDEVFAFSQRIGAPYDAVCETRREGRLRVPVFAAGGIRTAADAALMRKLGCDGVLVGQEIFECSCPVDRIKNIVGGVRSYDNPMELALASRRVRWI